MCGMAFANRKSDHGVLRRASAVVVLVMLAGAALTWLPLQTQAAEPEPAGEEFVAFLEYLGSWDGNEAEWVQFLDASDADSAGTRDAAAATASANPAASAERRDEDPELKLATTGR